MIELELLVYTDVTLIDSDSNISFPLETEYWHSKDVEQHNNETMEINDLLSSSIKTECMQGKNMESTK